MTLRYAKLASPTIRTAYQAAMEKIRDGQALPVAATAPAAAVPDHVQWLHAEMVKTRLAAGYCARHQAAGACPYANICEQCDNFVPAPDAADILSAQLRDVRTLGHDAATRGWDGENARHSRVADNLESHLRRLRQQPHPDSS